MKKAVGLGTPLTQVQVMQRPKSPVFVKPYQETFNVARRELEKQSAAKIKSFPKISMEDALRSKVPMSADRAEYWVLRLYLDKRTERELDAEKKIILDGIKDPYEKKKAELYLDKVDNRVINATKKIKDGDSQIDGDVKELKERTKDEIDNVHEKIKDIKNRQEPLVNFWKKIYEYAKKGVGFVVKVSVPTAGITYLNDIVEFVKNAEFWQKAIAVITVYALEELVINVYTETKKKRAIEGLEGQIKQIEENYDRDEKRFKEKASKYRDQIMYDMKKDIERLCETMYGCATSTERLTKEKEAEAQKQGAEPAESNDPSKQAPS